MAETTTPNDDQLPAYVIEGARSGRSRCKTCRRPIAKGGLRIGVLIEGPFGEGYLWHHLNCLARSRFAQVEEAYAAEAWQHAKEKPKGLPTLAKLSTLEEKARKQKAERLELPHAEIAPSGRSKCKLCGDAIAEGSPRVVLGREVEFGRQVRVAPVKVHVECVADELERPDSAPVDGDLAALVRAHSKDIDEAVLDQVCAALEEI